MAEGHGYLSHHGGLHPPARGLGVLHLDRYPGHRPCGHDTGIANMETQLLLSQAATDAIRNDPTNWIVVDEE